MKKHSKSKKGRSVRSIGKIKKAGKMPRKSANHERRKPASKPSGKMKAGVARQRQQPAHIAVHKAAEDVPTLEQVTITCANCGRSFKVLKLKGLSLEGTICQRCSFGEMELPENFG